MTTSPEALAQTHAAAFAEGRAWTAKEFSSLLQSRGAILCGDVRSFILGRVITDEAEVLTLATDPAFRRQGRAAAALAKFVHNATQAGATRVFLEVATDNDTAKALYYKAGFATCGQRPNYYTTSDGRRISADILQKQLETHNS